MSHVPHSSRRGFLAAGTGCLATLAVGRRCFADPPVQRDRDNRKLREVGRIHSGLTDTRRLCLTADRQVLVVAGRKLVEFRDCHIHQETLLARPARCLAFADDRLAIGFHNRCEVRGRHDEPLFEFHFPEGSLLSDLALSHQSLFAADAGQQVVWCCSLSTGTKKPVTRTARFSAPPEFFKLAVSAGGSQLFVANPGRHRIEQYTLDGRFVESWGTKSRDLEGFAGCCNPVSFALRPDGTFVTAERGQPRIKQFAADGQFIDLILDADKFPESLAVSRNDDGLGCSKGGFDVAIDRNGSVYVLDCATGEIRVLS